jgi:dipeptidyl aminopeptidase/acylaminoacyl peptidase
VIKKSLLISLLGFSSMAQAAVPLQNFFEPPQFKEAEISPSGRYLAFKIGNSNMRDGMVVIESETGKTVGGIRVDGYDVGNIRWVNDNRLVYNVVDYSVGPGDVRFAPGLYAVDRDGKNIRKLVHHHPFATSSDSRLSHRVEPWNTYLMDDVGAQDSEFIYARRPVWEEDSYALMRMDLIQLNTSTGQALPITRPARPSHWMLDQKGQPSVMVSEKDGQETVHYRDPANGEWRELASFKAYGDKGGITPVGFIDDKRMLVKARFKGDKTALHALDLTSGEVDTEPLVSLGDFDFSGEMVYSNKRLAGLHYLGDARGSVWFDANMKAIQAEVDKKLPHLINIITPPVAPEVPWLLVKSYSDRQPEVYSLFNSKTNELKLVGNSHPDINPADMGKQEMVKVKARDGLELPAWLTLPAQGGKKLPLVVMIHGGPYVRGTEWGWSPESQFLASRGYAVLEPEFRGSTGYGHGLFKAGVKQWGLSMQDDIADSVKWAVAQGYADPRRVCLLGGSYGGYATLMGLVKDGEMYRCGVAYSAVTDIPLWLDNGMAWESDVSAEYRKFGAPVLLGDVKADAERFDATSPLKQAARIKRPVLLAHGSDDRRVPVAHYAKMRKALKANDADAEFIEYSGEGHTWCTTEHRLDFWSRVEKFLDKHIGAGAKTE